MFRIFGVTKDANKAYAYLVNFLDYAVNSIGIFGFEMAAGVIAASEWAAGPSAREEGERKYLHFRLCVPFSSFYCAIDNDVKLDGSAGNRDAKITVEGTDDFFGFGLFAYSEGAKLQVYAMNGHQQRATARAVMLMSRFKTRGATDITNVLRGVY